MRLVVFLVVLLTFVLIIDECSCQVKKKRLKHCHFGQAFKCFDYLRIFTGVENGTGIVTNEKDWNLFCWTSTKYLSHCLRKWLKKCGNPVYSEMVNFFVVQPYVDSFHRFCDPRNGIKERFLKYSPCLHHMIKLSDNYRLECVQGIQAGFEKMSTLSEATESFAGFCCSYNRWEMCIKKHLHDMCGAEAQQIIVDLIHTMSMQMIGQLCPMDVFSIDSDHCLNVLPPLYTKPLGARSNSWFSYLFSYFCPNVGYGILPGDK